MKMENVISVIIAIGVMILGYFVIVPSIADAAEKTTSPGLMAAVQFIPIVVILIMAIMAIIITSKPIPAAEGEIEEIENTFDSDDDPIEPEGILKRRLARGEIQPEEYTKRMARL